MNTSSCTLRDGSYRHSATQTVWLASLFLTGYLLIGHTTVASGAEPAQDRNTSGTALELPPFILTTNEGYVLIVKNGKTVWSHAMPGCVDAWVLPTGNILLCGGKMRGSNAMMEITLEHEVVWRYDCPVKPEIQLFACQPLPEKRALLAESGAHRLVEVSDQGIVARIIPTSTRPHGNTGELDWHYEARGVRKTAQGTYLVANTIERAIVEYDGDGQRLRVFPVKTFGQGEDNCERIEILPDGHVLVATGKGGRLIEIVLDGDQAHAVWSFGQTDVPDTPIYAVFSGSSNGKVILVSAWLQDGKRPCLFIVDREKRVVWRDTPLVPTKDRKDPQLMVPAKGGIWNAHFVGDGFTFVSGTAPPTAEQQRAAGAASKERKP